MDDGFLRRHHILAQRAAPAAGAENLFVRADVIQAVPAVPAFAAAVMRLDDDPVADPEVFDLRADFHHIAGGFMPGDDRRDAERVLSVIGVHLGPADSAVADADFDIVRFFNLGFRAVVAEIRDAHSFKVSGSHKQGSFPCRRNRRMIPLLILSYAREKNNRLRLQCGSINVQQADLLR